MAISCWWPFHGVRVCVWACRAVCVRASISLGYTGEIGSVMTCRYSTNCVFRPSRERDREGQRDVRGARQRGDLCKGGVLPPRRWLCGDGRRLRPPLRVGRRVGAARLPREGRRVDRQLRLPAPRAAARRRVGHRRRRQALWPRREPPAHAALIPPVQLSKLNVLPSCSNTLLIALNEPVTLSSGKDTVWRNGFLVSMIHASLLHMAVLLSLYTAVAQPW